MTVRAWAPGRVNLMGDHTDHTGGLVLPMAIDLGTSVTGERGGDEVRLTSTSEPDVAVVPLDVQDPSTIEPAWARYVAGVVAEQRPGVGLDGRVDTTLPIGAGLSSSAALEVAVALALGFEGDAIALAELGQRAEQRASGVPCGIMDQLASAVGRGWRALRIDCTTLSIDAVALPDDLAVVVIDSGEPRTLAMSAYADRAEACQVAQRAIGPLRDASLEDVDAIDDPTVRRRARHVLTENERVDELVAALRADDRAALGEVMAASHASLRDVFEVSTPGIDALVERLAASSGVIGARLTGGGFGGCVVALTEPHVVLDLPERSWRVGPSPGAQREVAP